MRWLIGLCLWMVSYSAWSASGVRRFVYSSKAQEHLSLEILSDDWVHFEYSSGTRAPTDKDAIYSSPMVAKTDWSGPSDLQISEGTLSTSHLRVRVQPDTLCILVTDLKKSLALSSVCPRQLKEEWKGLEMTAFDARNVYGLGQHFRKIGSADGDWLGQQVTTNNEFGNTMGSFAGGATGDTQFPVMYAIGSGGRAFLFVLDNIYKQTWDLTGTPWNIAMFGDQVRGYLATGDQLMDLRMKYMDLVGKPPVPPRKMFGYWMSEYGYDNWNELRGKLDSMRRDHFPIDGFFMDLQWFGGVRMASDYTPMGKLTFDEENFPHPAETIAQLESTQGIGLVTIEEAYVGKKLEEHQAMEKKGFLAHVCGDPQQASYLTSAVHGNNEWWGKGGMIDWTNPHGAAYWHDWKRQPLADMGIVGHWLDLGEPEMYDRKACYHGFPEFGRNHHSDIHNVFSLRWAQSLYEGYQRNKTPQRPFAMLRSGTSGLQRYGAGMWSGDIGGNLESLATHHNAQMHMSFSGIDYYGADVGGFHRNTIYNTPLSQAETQENFTQWLGNATWFDFPVRSHVLNLDNHHQTAPNAIGHVESNLFNLRQRYRLIPYLYSLAHYANRYGTPIVPPMPMVFPDDPQVRQIGHQKFIGPYLMAAIVARAGETERNVYLPKGLWYDFRSKEWSSSMGEWVQGVPAYRDGLFQLPVYAAAGAIIPQMVVDDKTMNVFGRRTDKSEQHDLVLEVFASRAKTSFSVFEDDGRTMDYTRGEYMFTTITQQEVDEGAWVVLDAAKGRYPGSIEHRATFIRLATTDRSATAVFLNDKSLKQCDSHQELDQEGTACWYNESKNTVVVRTPVTAVRTAQNIFFRLSSRVAPTASANFVCHDVGDLQRHLSVFVSGNIPELGAWDVKRAIPLKMQPFVPRTWTGMVYGLPTKSKVEWKCLIRPANAEQDPVWQPGPNSVVQTAVSGFSGSSHGGFRPLVKKTSQP